MNKLQQNTTNHNSVLTKTTVQNTLINLGVPPSLLGFSYITDAILLVYDHPEYKHQVTKKLYPEVAEKGNSTSGRVERAMRHAIDIAWLRGDEELLADMFGYTVSASKGKPTNSEFISMVLLRLEQNNYKVVKSVD
jgi:two-component system response regulator (stage 0 sporulation protein A)